MATRTPHTGVAGEVLTAASLAKYPKGWLGHDNFTGPTTVDSSEDTIGSLAVTVGASRLIKITVRASVSDLDNNAIEGTVRVERDGNDLGRVHRQEVVELGFVAGFVLDTPSAGSRTYAVVAETTSGDMAVASSTILIEDIGPSS